MAIAGQSYIVKLNNAHLMWGSYHPSRHGTPGVGRNEVYGEGYIKIPSRNAHAFQIFNASNPFGISDLYNCVSYEGYYTGVLKAQGCSTAGDMHAKQFAESGNLKGIGDWYDYVGAVAGDYVKVKFTSSNSIIIEHNTMNTGFHI